MAATLPAGFAESVYVAGFDTPTAQAFAPDGRLFVLEKAGKVRVVTAAGGLNSTPFTTLTVDTAQDRGLVALTFDPNFQSNGYLYLWYSKTDSAGTRTRLSRFQASTSNPNIAQAGSERVLLEVPHATNIHTGGAMGFGADGMLYLGVGDGGESFRAQDLGDLRGKILRLNVANPSNLIPSDNPYVGVSGARPEIYAYGMRNPFSGQMKPGTNAFYVNDVGQDAFEEINVIQRGENFGWPNAEGASSSSSDVDPIYSYSHAGFSSAAITGGAFYTSNQFPAEYANSYFFADYLNGFMRRVDSAGNSQSFGTNVSGPLDIDLGPDGSLYYISAFGNGFNGTNRPIYRISYTANANRAPAAVASTTTAPNGLAPLAVGFTGNGSSDPDGDSLTYTWNFGDSTSATGKDVSHTYTSNGTYFATLTVNDGRGGTNTSQSIRIDVGNRAPIAAIQTPSSTFSYTANQTISFSGSATDPDDGTLAASGLSWMVYLVHNTHEHQFAGPFNGTASGSFFVPTNGHVEADHHYRIELTATDSAGLSTKTSREIFPVTSTVTLASSITGLSLALDGQPRSAPFSSGSLVNATRALSAPLTQTLNGATYEFVSWSDGGAATHDITIATADTTYTATYRLATPAQQALTPTADSYVRSSSSGSNYGTASSLYARKSTKDNRYSYFKFDTTAVTGTVENVKLRLYGKLESTAATGVRTEVFGTGTSWTESGLKWSNKPAASTAALATVTVSGTTSGWYELDVTAYVNAERAAARKVIGLVLINPTTSTPAILFNSRQASSNKPQLLVTTGSGTPVPTQTPFSGTPIAVPSGTIEAENFDNGGEGVAYHDVTPANEGDNAGYRSSAVDLEIAGDTSGGANVGWIKAGEWLEYTINIATAGTYSFDARVAMLGAGGAFSVTLDGAPLTTFSIPDTGGYQSYQTVTKTGLTLPAGQHVLRVFADTEGPSGFAGNINWLRFNSGAVVTPPLAPTNLTASSPTSGQVNLAWTDASNNETGFKIERKTGASGTWAQIATTTLPSYSDATVAAATAYVYRVRATNSAGDSATSNEVALTTPAAPTGQTPFGGAARPIAGTIEAEDFDNGGEGVAYHDLDSAQQGGVYRTTGVDVETSDDTGGGYNVGYIKAGEWLEYTVNVATAGNYNFDIRIASGNPGGAFHIEFDGVDKTGAIALPYTGGWSNWQTVSASNVSLPAGTHVMRLAIDSSNLAGADVGRINWIRVTPFSVATQTPFYSSPLPISGRIQAEDFDNGGEGVAYHDTTSANEAGTNYRNSGVEIEVSGDTGGGYNVGWLKTGEWLEYTINVGTAGYYQLDLRVASQGAGGTVTLLFDGIDRTGPIPIADTGGWQTYTTLTKSVQLNAGVQVMRVRVNSVGSSGFAGNINYFNFTAAGTASSSPSSAALLEEMMNGLSVKK